MSRHKNNHKHNSHKKRAGAGEEVQKRTTLTEALRSGRLRFAVAFALSCIGLYIAIQALPPSFTRPINEHTASTLGLVLNAFGITVFAINDTVSEGMLVFRIIPDCTALFTSGLFFCFIVFYPATFRQKASGLAMGIPVLYLGNLVRLTATFLLSRYDRTLFEVVHVYLGQVFTIFMVILVCIAWLQGLEGKEPKQSTFLKSAEFLGRFVLISGCLFILWTQVHHWYISLLDRIMLFGFSLFHERVDLARQTLFYYETFSIVGLVSLVLAVRSTPWLTKIKGLAAGMGFLFFIHLFHRIDNALIAYFNFTSVLPVDLTLLAVGQYLVPVLFLIFLLSKNKKIRAAEGNG